MKALLHHVLNTPLGPLTHACNLFPKTLLLLGLGVIDNVLLVLDLNVLNTPLGPLTLFVGLTRPIREGLH